MTEYDNIVPQENLALYKLLYQIEVGLREFFIETFEARCGSLWWKQKLPGDVLEKCRGALDDERQIKWSQLVSHHPLYYVDFPDLKKIIERSDNWKQIFQSVFKRKDVIIGTLTELEPIRNKLAHNRKATATDLSIAVATFQKIAAAVGETLLNKLISRCTSAQDILGNIHQLQEEAEQVYRCCRQIERLESLETWERIKTTWWFDSDYLGNDLQDIQIFFDFASTYSQFTRSRGSGHKIETWLKSQNLKGKYECARLLFLTLLQTIMR